MQDATNIDIEIYARPPDEIEDGDLGRDWETFISNWSVIRERQGDCNWTLGDLVDEFARTFGDRKGPDGRTPLDKWAADLGEAPGTLKQYRWVSTKFPKRDDRMTGLSWTHYRSAAGTNVPMYWINKAVENNWTTAALDEAIREAGDQSDVAEGKPCVKCGYPLPETGAIHTRRDGHKNSFCCVLCLLDYYLEIHRTEKAQAEFQEKVLAEADEAQVSEPALRPAEGAAI